MPGCSRISSNLLSVLVLSLSLVPLSAASNGNHDWQYEESREDSRDFVPGDMLHVHMSVGDLHIKRGDTNRISLHYTVKSKREKNVKEAHVNFDVHGNDAIIEFHSPTVGNT